MNKLVVFVILLANFALYAQTETQLRMYRPFTEGVEQPALTVTRSLDAHCDAQSVFLPRADAWRCTSEEGELDPCFVQPRSKTLLCPLSPWHAQATRIAALSLANNTHFTAIDMAHGKPWAVEMSNGQRCLAVEETEKMDNQPISFACAGGDRLLGKLHRCKMQWSVLWSNGKEIEERGVKTVWF
ncbi:MAG: hypothetical protein JJT82_07020 [Legionellaceae bacterium]|nr:hypothetical protein [Legionellaceae bacterium]